VKIQFIFFGLLLSLSTAAQQTTSSYNTPYGVSSMTSITSGRFNSGFGRATLRDNNSGSFNTAFSNVALILNLTGTYNSGFGASAGLLNGSGVHNSAVGYNAAGPNATGDNNTSVGFLSNLINKDGSKNTVFGFESDVSSSSAENQTVLGANSVGQADNSVVLGNQEVTAVYMAEDGKAVLYAGPGIFNGDVTIQNGDANVLSDSRLKSNIVSLGATAARLLLIDGKSYTMKSTGQQKNGVLAQEVKKVFPQLISETESEMLSVNYQGLIPVLINALKEQQQQIEILKQLISQRIAEKEVKNR
jgi:hypothetical protein